MLRKTIFKEFFDSDIELIYIFFDYKCHLKNFPFVGNVSLLDPTRYNPLYNVRIDLYVLICIE